MMCPIRNKTLLFVNKTTKVLHKNTKKIIKLNSSPVCRKRFHCNFWQIYMHLKNTAC